MNGVMLSVVVGSAMFAPAPEVPPEPPQLAVKPVVESGPELGKRVPHLKVQTAAGRVCFQCALG